MAQERADGCQSQIDAGWGEPAYGLQISGVVLDLNGSEQVPVRLLTNRLGVPPGKLIQCRAAAGEG